MSLLDAVALDSLLHNDGVPRDKLFSLKRLEALPAIPGDYKYQVEFDTLSTTGKWCLWKEGWIQLPLQISPKTLPSGSPATGGFGNYPVIAFKGSVLSLFNGVSVRTGDGRTIFEERDRGVFANHLRLMLETHSDWYVSNGEDIHWAKDRAADGVFSGLTSKDDITFPKTARYAANPGGSNNQDNPAFNLGFLERNNMLLQSTMKLDGTFPSDYSAGFPVTLNIPLRYIHSFFEALDFPIINSRMLFTFFLNTTTAGRSYQPMCLGSRQNGNHEADPDTEIITAISGQPRLYYHAVSPQGPEAEAIAQKLLQGGFSKEVRFKIHDMNRLDNNHTSTGSYRFTISNNTIDPQRVYVMCYPSGVVDGSTWPSPIVTGSDCSLRDITLYVGGENYYGNRVDSLQDQYALLKEVLPLNADITTSSTMTYGDWLLTHRILCFDLRRRGELLSKHKGVATTLEIEATPVLRGGASMEVIYLVETEKRVVLQFGQGDFKIEL